MKNDAPPWAQEAALSRRAIPRHSSHTRPIAPDAGGCRPRLTRPLAGSCPRSRERSRTPVTPLDRSTRYPVTKKEGTFGRPASVASLRSSRS